ncbi:MAG: glycoside hydrolase family 28 protein, partial [Acidobacteria bacterium]|nr:glycoside hydrolase family 28 protein [Acidobacteriota bacterium]
YFHDVHIWNIKATGAKMVFDVAGNPKKPVEHFEIDHLDVQAGTAGHISAARDWNLHDLKLQIADGSSVALEDTQNIKGLTQNSKKSDANAQTPHKYEE